MEITLTNRETRAKKTFTVVELLHELNRDRSDEWTEYTANDPLYVIIEGINNFTEWEA